MMFGHEINNYLILSSTGSPFNVLKSFTDVFMLKCES